VLDRNHKASTVRNGSCGDPLIAGDVPEVIRALSELGLLSAQTMIAPDDAPAVFPCLDKRPAARWQPLPAAAGR
jgi:hypothetical protein